MLGQKCEWGARYTPGGRATRSREQFMEKLPKMASNCVVGNGEMIRTSQEFAGFSFALRTLAVCSFLLFSERGSTSTRVVDELLCRSGSPPPMLLFPVVLVLLAGPHGERPDRLLAGLVLCTRAESRRHHRTGLGQRLNGKSQRPRTAHEKNPKSFMRCLRHKQTW